MAYDVVSIDTIVLGKEAEITIVLSVHYMHTGWMEYERVGG